MKGLSRSPKLRTGIKLFGIVLYFSVVLLNVIDFIKNYEPVPYPCNFDEASFFDQLTFELFNRSPIFPIVIGLVISQFFFIRALKKETPVSHAVFWFLLSTFIFWAYMSDIKFAHEQALTSW